MSLHHVDVKGLSPTPSVVKRDHVRDRVELLVDDVRALPGCLKLIRWYGDQHPHLLTHVVGQLPGVLVVPVLLISLSLRHVVMHQLRQGLHLVTEAHDILHYGHFRRVRLLFPGFSYQPKGSPDSPAVQELEGGEPRRGLRNLSRAARIKRVMAPSELNVTSQAEDPEDGAARSAGTGQAMMAYCGFATEAMKKQLQGVHMNDTAICPAPDKPTDGMYDPEKDEYTYLDALLVVQIQLQCKMGYECQAVCATPRNYTFAEPEESFTIYFDKTTVLYKCKPGYIRDPEVHQNQITCSGRSWSELASFCSPISCGHPGKVNNANRIGSEFTFGNRVDYICQEGYMNTLQATPLKV
ncbi:unnamed protein product [Ranitomeya imitator]|uniref:Sushi domain-containing protein n=1 Tax=Ranitomeya imitator TaxID=111125 RepID=A0ABN9M1N5_9NEOB|nr:unnamed protein product [Ranitomeya imitator]